MPGAARGRGVFGRIRRAGLVALTALGRRDLCAMCAVRGEHSVKSSEVDPRLRHPRNKSGNELSRPAQLPRQAPPQNRTCGTTASGSR
jgi:hypothetical protein